MASFLLKIVHRFLINSLYSVFISIRGQSHCRDSGRQISTNDTFTVVLRASVKGSLPFLLEGFEMFKIFAADELLIYIRTVFLQ